MCRPLGVADLPILLLLLATLFLLLPDFSEIAIPGVVSLRQRVSEQETRQTLLENRVAQVQTNIQTMRQQVNVQVPQISDELLRVLAQAAANRAQIGIEEKESQF